MRVFAFLRGPLMAILILLALALGITPFLVRSTEDAMQRALRYDVAWIGVHGREEFHQLMRALLELPPAPGRREVEAVRQAQDIFHARLETWRRGAFKRLAEQLPNGEATLAAIIAEFEALDGLLARLPAGGAAAQALAGARRIEPLVEELSRDAFTQSLDDMSRNRDRLSHLQLGQRILIIALVIGGFLLVGLLVRHNRLLAKAHGAARMAASENAFLARHDPLTRLRNRSSILAVLAEMGAGPAAKSTGCVMMIDLDGFKPINDVLGHKAGDALLTSVAERLMGLIGKLPGGSVGRFGGDEFVVVLEANPAQSPPLEVAQAVLQRLHAPHTVDGHRVSIDASIGIALQGGETLSPAEWINRADIALVRAKALGKGRALVYEDGMGEEIAARQRLESDMAEADLWAQFVPFYQPVVDLISGRIVAVETLARWRHPQRGMVSPGEFIPVAESSGRIVDIGWVILEKACRDAALLPPDVTVAVNISAVQLMRTDVHLRIDEIRRRTGLAPSRLKLEVTESVLINDARSVRTALDHMQRMGVAISLDDFGTGYSSLSYLSGFGFNELKIDRQFVHRMVEDARSLSIVQTIVALARGLDMTTVGEGIETEEQARMLLALGCVRGQGYRFGRPEPIEQLQERFAPAAPLRVA